MFIFVYTQLHSQSDIVLDWVRNAGTKIMNVFNRYATFQKQLETSVIDEWS